MQRTCEAMRSNGNRIAIVPTMGALHEGHLHLIREAKTRADRAITTVFVNPAQFGPSEDFEKYPRDLRRDIDLAASVETDFVFAPETLEMYPRAYETYVTVENLGNPLEGKSRPGHFRGVTTVVAKLFNITRPHVALFGQKDAQQVLVIRRMVDDLNFGIEVVVVPTVREADGLALSSRNAYLSPVQRHEAPVLYRSLQLARKRIGEGAVEAKSVIMEMLEMITTQTSGTVDYISIADHQSLSELQSIELTKPVLVSLAVRFGNTRLIDNEIVRPE